MIIQFPFQSLLITLLIFAFNLRSAAWSMKSLSTNENVAANRAVAENVPHTAENDAENHHHHPSKHNTKRRHKGRKNGVSMAKEGRKGASDVVLLLDAGGAMINYYSDVYDRRAQTIAVSLVNNFDVKKFGDHIAIVKFDQFRSKILHGLEEWKQINFIQEQLLAINEDFVVYNDMYYRLQYAHDKQHKLHYIGSFGMGLKSAIDIFNHSKRKNNKNVQKVVIIVTAGHEMTEMSFADELKNTFGAHIMAVIIGFKKRETKYYEDLYKIVTDPSKDIFTDENYDYK